MENPTIIEKLQAKKSKKGFTLVELVIVIAILAILAAIAIPVVISTINSANVSTFKSDTATCELLLKACINEQKGRVGTNYGTTESPILADGTTDIFFRSVADKNGYTGGFTKNTSEGIYKMWWTGTKLVAATEENKPSGANVFEFNEKAKITANGEVVAGGITTDPTNT